MREQLEARLTKLGRRGHRTLAAGVAHDGERVFSAWSADGAEPDAGTLFEIGSITKAFTGVLLADMHLRGEVSLEDRCRCTFRRLDRRGDIVSPRFLSWRRTAAGCRTRRGR